MRFLLLIVTLFSTQAVASHVEHCRLNAQVVSIDQAFVLGSVVTAPNRTATLAVTNATRLDGSYVDCQAFANRHLNVFLGANETLAEGELVTLTYQYADGLTPDGVGSDELLRLDDRIDPAAAAAVRGGVCQMFEEQEQCDRASDCHWEAGECKRGGRS